MLFITEVLMILRLEPSIWILINLTERKIAENETGISKFLINQIILMYHSSTKETLDPHCDLTVVTSWQNSKLHKGLFTTRYQAVAGRKKGHIEAWDDRQLDTYKQDNLVRKKNELTHTLNFFLVLTGLFTGLTPPIGVP